MKEKKCAPFTLGLCSELVGRSCPHVLLFPLFGLDILETLPDPFFLSSTDEAKELVDAAYKYERDRSVHLMLSILGVQFYQKHGNMIPLFGEFLLYKYVFIMAT